MPWHFGPFRLDLTQAGLWRAEQPVPLRPKTLALLAYLVAHAGQLVTKEALLGAVWPETAVGDGVLKTSIGELRKALGETARAPQWIATVQRRGYRFLAPVAERPDVVPGPAGPMPPIAPQTPLVEPPTAPAAPPRETSAVLPPQGTVLPPVALPSPAAERRHLTVLFCDLVDSTALAEHLDPEDLREVVRAYHQTCAEMIQRFDGYIAQYLGDGVLVYFGYPVAHEDDAQRAVRTGLGILHAMDPLNARLTLPPGDRLAVRLGIHTGLVVVGEVRGGARQEPLALGVTPNLAARLQALAAPNTLVISAATWQLLSGFFVCQPLDTRPIKGLAQPLAVYQVLSGDDGP
jgi:class 3 adenylate cyclase/DNA-binding winged helix-turn-helix (wHTH) protein